MISQDRGPSFAAPTPGFHHMRDQRLDLDDLAALGLWRHVDEGAGHGQLYSRQAAMVTITSTVSDYSEPSLNSASNDILRIRKADAGREGRLAGARAKMHRDDVTLRI